MNLNGLANLYDQLTPEERFKLDVEAMARGDTEESARLVHTCPTRNYQMNEIGFTDRWQAALQITTMICMDVDKHLSKVQMVEAFRVLLPYLRAVMENDGHEAYHAGHERGARFAWEKAGKEGDPPGYGPDLKKSEREADPDIEAGAEDVSVRAEAAEEAVKRMIDKLKGELARDGYSAWSAYLTFCEDDMGVEPHKMLLAYNPQVAQRGAQMESMAERLELETKPETLEECLGAIRGLRYRYMGRNPDV